MKVDLLNLRFNKIGTLSIPEKILDFNIKFCLIKYYLDWQRSSQMSGNHKVKTSAEVAGSTKKPFRQKGTGNARQGNVRSPVLRGGGVSHGPVVRNHSISINKKVKDFAVRSALSYKYLQNKLKIFKDFSFDSHKTSNIKQFIKKNVLSTVCFVYLDERENKNFLLSCRAISGVKTLSCLGVNIFDILKYEYLFFSEAAFKSLIKNFKI